MVRDTSVQLAPPEIGNAQIVDYRQRNADSAFALVNALVAAPPPPALPDLLPPPPLVPMSYMNTYREQVEAEALSYHDQAALYLDLRGHLQDEDGHDAALGLLRRLRQRRDIVESVGRDIDTLLANVPDLPAAPDLVTPEVPTTPQTAPGWYPDPTRRYEQRYWDGTTWTDNVARGGQQFRDVGQQQQTAHTGSGPTQTVHTAHAGHTATAIHAPSDDRPFDTGTLVLLHLASVFCTFGLVGVIAGFMNMNKPARRSQAMVLLIVGFVVLGLVLLSVVAASSSTNSDF
jgi:hypothetical protein